MACNWKSNWDETRQRFTDWWNQNGIVLGMWGQPPRATPRVDVPDPGPAADVQQQYLDAAWRARADRRRLARADFPLDVLPLCNTDLGPGSLCLPLGSEAGLETGTVWYEPCIVDPAACPSIQFDPGHPWWVKHEEIIGEQLRVANGDYLVPCPDLIENIDVLSSLRGADALMMDMLVDPDWVKDRLLEINQAFFQAYDRVYDLIRDEAGGAAFGAFCLWGPGKTVKVQADASAMISPHQFEEFVLPALREQCAWLDFSMYHLDGTQCIHHLDLLLGMEELDAIEWTPQAGRPGGGAPEWYDLYRRVIEAGKSVQAVGVLPHEVGPLLDAIGTNGVYILAASDGTAETFNAIVAEVEKYR